MLSGQTFGKMRGMGVLLCLALALLLAVSSCGSDEQEEILVFAAASLADVMERISHEFAGEEGVRVRFNLGGSTALAQGIVHGAPADAFISAGPQPMDLLEEQGFLVADTRVDILTNELVLVGRASEGIASVDDLVTTGARVAIADPELAPAGRYAREALQSLKVWQRLEPRLVPGPNVRVALGYVETGNVDAGIVYRTDFLASEGLEILAQIPPESHSPILYPAAVVHPSQHVDPAQKFLDFLRSAEAGEVFREHGFIPIPPGEE